VRTGLIGAVWLFAAMTTHAFAQAQGNNYTQTNLDSRVPGLALLPDKFVRHPWGMAVSAGQPIRIAMNVGGQFRSYDGNGIPQDPRGVIDVPAGTTAMANPTGVAANTTGKFIPPGSLSSPFLFATRQGTISAEFSDGRGDIKTTTILVVDHGAQGAEYTGLALVAPDCCEPYLAAADFHRGVIEAFDTLFEPVQLPGAFVDPNLPAGYAPWNITVIGGQVFVAYAPQDAAGHDPVAGAGNGIVDIFAVDGGFLRRLVSNGALNVPSGMVQAGAHFGAFSNAILIGNFGDGLIHAFDPQTGQLLGTLKDGNGNAIVNPELHSLAFGDGTNAGANFLYLTAALEAGTDGIFALIAVNESGAGPDFALTASPPNVTVGAGQTASFSVQAAPVGNFRGVFSFTCNAPAAVACTLGAPAVDPDTGTATVGVTAKVTPSSSSPTPMLALALPGVLLAGLGCNRRCRRSAGRAVFLGLGLLVVIVAGASGCSSSNRMTPQRTTESLTVTVTSGAVSHAAMLTVNVE
jgi:uncharacterized protein (TIGR03118 family)